MEVVKYLQMLQTLVNRLATLAIQSRIHGTTWLTTITALWRRKHLTNRSLLRGHPIVGQKIDTQCASP